MNPSNSIHPINQTDQIDRTDQTDQFLEVIFVKRKLVTTTLIIFLLAVFPAVALAGSAILHWQAVSAPDLAGYRIY